MISMSNHAILSFLAGMVFNFLLHKFDNIPLKIRQIKTAHRIKVVRSELEDTDVFITAMRDATRDDLRLRRYKPKERRTTPLALTSTPAPVGASMDRMSSWMRDHGISSSNKPETPPLMKVVSDTRRRR